MRWPASQNHNRDIYASEDITQFVAEVGQFRISLLQLLVQSDELFITGLELFFGRLQLLVGAMKLLHAGLGFFVRRPQFLVGRFLLLDDRLEVVASPGEIIPHLD